MSKRICQLCQRELPDGEWGYADDGWLCHPDDEALQDCYTLWTVFGVRDLAEAPEPLATLFDEFVLTVVTKP